MPSSTSPPIPELLGVQIRRGPAGDDLVVALRYAYSDKPPSQQQRTRMVRDLLLLQALSCLDGGAASVSFTDFREDAIKRLRTDEFHFDPNSE